MADWREKFYGQHYALKVGKIAKNISECKAVLSEGDSLLDVGCNIGSVYGEIRPKNYEGIDLDSKAVDEARRRFPGVNFHVGDLFELEGQWDVVLVSRVLMHVAPLDEAMKRLLSAARKHLVLFVPIAGQDECEVHSHDVDGCRVDSYFRRFSEKTLKDFGRCRITERTPYSTVIYDR